jgi:heme-degrading monooxygenase HmoA
MCARLTTIEGLPDRMDDATRHMQEQTLPQLRQMDGFKGFVALGDRNSGRLVGVAFWESEEALRATEQEVSGVRSGAAQAVDGSVASVEQYEVVVYEAPSTGPVKRGHRYGARCRGQPLGGRGEAELGGAGNPPPQGEKEGRGTTHRPSFSCLYAPECVEGGFSEASPLESAASR